MPPAEHPVETALDHRLVRMTALASAACLLPAVLLGGAVGGRLSALGAFWGVAAVGLNGVAAAWVSAQGAASQQGIAIGRVLIAIPLRLVVLGALAALGVGPLGLPGAAVGYAILAAESVVMFVQSWLVFHGATIVGPIQKGVSG